MNIDSNNHITLVDAHVHIYECYTLPVLLNAVVRNFERVALRIRRDDQYSGVLLLAEARSDQWYRRLTEFVDGGTLIGESGNYEWRFERLGSGECGVRCMRADGATILVVAGRQIVTAEGLEILALLTEGTIDDGLEFDIVMRSIRESGGIIVLPWGVGKWLGKRGRIVTRILQSNEGNDLFLGDNSGRPVFWGTPAHFARAAARGIRILPGSDPLPLASQYSRIGDFGFRLDHKLSDTYPIKDLRSFLVRPGTSISRYGHLESPVQFFKNQFLIRVRKTKLSTSQHSNGIKQ